MRLERSTFSLGVWRTAYQPACAHPFSASLDQRRRSIKQFENKFKGSFHVSNQRAQSFNVRQHTVVQFCSKVRSSFQQKLPTSSETQATKATPSRRAPPCKPGPAQGFFLLKGSFSHATVFTWGSVTFTVRILRQSFIDWDSRSCPLSGVQSLLVGPTSLDSLDS